MLAAFFAGNNCDSSHTTPYAVAGLPVRGRWPQCPGGTTTAACKSTLHCST